MVAREEVVCRRPLESLFSERAKRSLEDMESGSEIVEMWSLEDQLDDAILPEKAEKWLLDGVDV
jgi:hypothetical protein